MSHENLLHGTFLEGGREGGEGGGQSMSHENLPHGTFVDGGQSMSYENLLHGTFVEGSRVCHMRTSYTAPLSRGEEYAT